MTSRDFCYWLQGFFEINEPTEITPKQTQQIKNHLKMVFKHEIDPSMGDEQHQLELGQLHEGSVSTSSSLKFPQTEEEAILVFGPKPSKFHKFNMHGWYDPKQTILKC